MGTYLNPGNNGFAGVYDESYIRHWKAMEGKFFWLESAIVKMLSRENGSITVSLKK